MEELVLLHPLLSCESSDLVCVYIRSLLQIEMRKVIVAYTSKSKCNHMNDLKWHDVVPLHSFFSSV